LNAQQQYQTTRISRIQAQALRYNDTAALFQALGGGWWNKEWCEKQCLYEKS
jgi:outer membrane protein TolC